jgi:ribonuclease D
MQKEISMKVFLHTYDLPDTFIPSATIAFDTEAMGLKNHRDRLCVVQLSNGDGDCHLVHFPKRTFNQSPNLVKVLTNPEIVKIFHYARFDVALLMKSFGIKMDNLYCTKIASKLARTFTGKHSLKDLCKEFFNVELSKQEQTSDWGRAVLSPEQQQYAATDVLYLHDMKKILDDMLIREDRMDVATKCFSFLPLRAQFDLEAGEEFDVFSYKSE